MVLSFISAMLQAVSAVVLVSVAFLVLRGTAIKMTDATWFMEAASYALIAVFGFWLLVTKLRPRRADGVAVGGAGVHDHHHAITAITMTTAMIIITMARAKSVRDLRPFACAGPENAGRADELALGLGGRRCRRPSPLFGCADRFDLRDAERARCRRRCVSVFAMALGTAITVSDPSDARRDPRRTRRCDSPAPARCRRGCIAAIEIGGAALVMLLGIILLRRVFGRLGLKSSRPTHPRCGRG